MTEDEYRVVGGCLGKEWSTEGHEASAFGCFGHKSGQSSLEALICSDKGVKMDRGGRHSLEAF